MAIFYVCQYLTIIVFFNYNHCNPQRYTNKAIRIYRRAYRQQHEEHRFVHWEAFTLHYYIIILYACSSILKTCSYLLALHEIHIVLSPVHTLQAIFWRIIVQICLTSYNIVFHRWNPQRYYHDSHSHKIILAFGEISINLHFNGINMPYISDQRRTGA